MAANRSVTREMMKRWLLFFLLLLALFAIRVEWPESYSEELIAHDFQGGFASSNLPDLEEIMSRPFYFLGKGLQSIAFVSEDGRTVIKFFLNKHPCFQKKVGFFFSRKKKEPINVLKALKNYDVAFQELREETGLIGVHLVATQTQLPRCAIRDWRGKEHRIDLNRASFVLQHKCLMLDDACKTGSAEKILAALSALLEKRARKGFTDIKRRFNVQNYGLLGANGVMIDPGNLEYVEELKANPKAEVDRILKWARARIEKRHPGFL